MATALATLPFMGATAGDGDVCLTATAGGAAGRDGACRAAGLAGALDGFGAALATGLADAVFFGAALADPVAFLGAALAAGSAVFREAALASGLAVFFAGAFGWDLAALPAGAAFFTAGAGLRAAVLPAGAFAAGAFFAGAFFATALPADLAAGFAATLPTAGLRARGFFTAGLPAAGAAFRAAALLPARALLAASLGLAVLAGFALTAVFPFCALAAVELRVVFAISLSPFWPWRPGVIAHASYTSNRHLEYLEALHAASRLACVNEVTRFLLLLLGLYKRLLSPLLGPRCRFHPSCSDYARIAIVRFGPVRGGALALWRILRCQPLCAGGQDPVPAHFRFTRCRSHPDH